MKLPNTTSRYSWIPYSQEFISLRHYAEQDPRSPTEIFRRFILTDTYSLCNYGHGNNARKQSRDTKYGLEKLGCPDYHQIVTTC